MIIAVKFGEFMIRKILEIFQSIKPLTFSMTFSTELVKKEHSQKKISEHTSIKPISNMKETLIELLLKKFWSLSGVQVRLQAKSQPMLRLPKLIHTHITSQVVMEEMEEIQL